MQHPQARILGRQGIQHLGRVVLGAVVDRNHFDVRVVLAERRVNGVGGVVTLVVARDKDRDQRLTGQWRRQRVSFPRPVTLPVQAEIQAAGDPQPGHEQGIEKHEVHQELPGDQEDHAQGNPQHDRQYQQG
ncbi:hypothetical protein D3C80_1607570 [compost metagenome]